MISIKHLSKQFGKKIIYEDFSYIFNDHGIIAIRGESGCGKTTLLRMIAGLDKKYSGEIHKDSSKISYVFQDACLLPSSNALENVALVLGKNPKANDIAKDWLIRLGLQDDLYTYPDEMSGGMKKRVSIARALAYDASIILLDEPFNGLDSQRCIYLMDVLKEEAKTKLCIIVTHNGEHLQYLGCEVIDIK